MRCHYVFPCRGINQGQFIGGDPDNVAIACMKFGNSKRQLSEECMPCPWDAARSPKHWSRETSERMKEDVVNDHAGKIDHVLRFNCRVSKARDRGLRKSETYKDSAGHNSHPRDAQWECHDEEDKSFGAYKICPTLM